jgi:hypothetical protein
VRGKFAFNDNHFPIQDGSLDTLRKDENGSLKIVKDVVLPDWKDALSPRVPDQLVSRSQAREAELPCG